MCKTEVYLNVFVFLVLLLLSYCDSLYPCVVSSLYMSHVCFAVLYHVFVFLINVQYLPWDYYMNFEIQGKLAHTGVRWGNEVT